MAHGDRIKISLRNESGLYYYATQNGNNIYTVGTQAGVRYIEHLPLGWEGLKITWNRNPDYWGVIRSDSNTIQFVKDARAILLSLLCGGGGADAYCLMTIYVWNEDTFGYDVFYPSEIDFSITKDDKPGKKINTNTLDSKIYELLKANSNSAKNIPLWEYVSGAWNHTGSFAYHDGIKLLFSSTWIGAPKDTNHVKYQIGTWDSGNHGPSEGVHTIPALDQQNIVQNNGTTTYIGNDILEPVLLVGKQGQYSNEVSFTDGSKPYENYLFKNTLETAVNLNVELSAVFEIDPSTGNYIDWTGGSDRTLTFCLFEVDENNNAAMPIYTYISLYDLILIGPPPATPPFIILNTVTNVTFNPGKTYVFGIVQDFYPAGGTGANTLTFFLSKLEVRFISYFNNGTSAPAPAPMWSPTTIAGFKPSDLWAKLVQAIDSTTTNAFGFPDIIGAYTGVSTFLASTPPPEDNYGLIPSQILLASQNSVRNIQGQQYVTASIADFFTTWFNMAGCGLGIEGDTLRIERLEYFFDASTQIMDLGTNISGFTIEPFIQGRFNNINCGYSEPETNNDFGVDEYNMPAKYRLPLNKLPKVKDLSITTVTAGQNEIEKIRQQTNDAIQSNPSAPSNMVILQLDSTTVSGETQQPDGTPESVIAYNLLKYPTAQSTDPTAATAPYIKGLYFPDTAINVNLFPAKNLLRLGRFLRSMLDQLDSSVISYCNQYQMNYNDPSTVLTLPGISTNIYGQTVNSVADIPVSSLDAKLFRPYLLKFTATYPESMYAIINSNPRGYIRFAYIDDNGQQVEFKGFIWSVTQEVGNNSATNFELLCHPDVSDAALGLN